MNGKERLSAAAVIRYAGLGLCFILARLLAAVPFLIPLPLSFWPGLFVRSCLSLLVILTVLSVERLFRARAFTASVTGVKAPAKPILSMIRAGIHRYIRVLPLLILFLVPAVLLVYAVFDDGSNLKAMRMLKNIGGFFNRIVSVQSSAPAYDIGTMLLIGLALVFLVLLMLAWHRDVPLDYGRKPAGFRKKHPKEARKLTLINLLLCFPAWLLGILVIVRAFLSQQTPKQGGLFSRLLSAPKMIASSLQDSRVIIFLLLILFFIHLPLWCIRKYRTAALFSGGNRDED